MPTHTHTLTHNLHNHQRVREAVCEFCCLWLIVGASQNGFGSDLTCVTTTQTPEQTVCRTLLRWLRKVCSRGTRGAADCLTGGQRYISPGWPTSPWKANTLWTIWHCTSSNVYKETVFKRKISFFFSKNWGCLENLQTITILAVIAVWSTSDWRKKDFWPDWWANIDATHVSMIVVQQSEKLNLYLLCLFHSLLIFISAFCWLLNAALYFQNSRDMLKVKLTILLYTQILQLYHWYKYLMLWILSRAY